MDGRPTFRHRCEYIAFRTVASVAQALTPGGCRTVATALATLILCLPRKLTRYNVAAANLQTAFGPDLSPTQTRQLIHGMWRHLFLMVAEMLQLPRRLRVETVTELIQFRQKREVVTALSSGRPVLLLSGHFGNWEMAVSVFGLFGYRMGVIGRTLDNPYIERWFRAFRGGTGHVPLAKKGSYDDMLALLSRGGALALLADQDAGSGGVFVDFFGKPASTHKSLALLALEYDALICVGYARRLDGELTRHGLTRFELGCEAVVDPRNCRSSDPVREVTQAYTLALESAIRRAPEQYFWVHRRWKTAPDARAKKRLARKAA